MRRLSSLLFSLTLLSGTLHAQSSSSDAHAGIEAFNRTLANATRRMDNDTVLSLWDEDGVSLLPSTKPLEGKATIGAFVRGVTASFPGAHMVQFDMRCHDIAVSGDWASEWCTEHQVVHFADGKPPFDGWGKMLYVLHRGRDGLWRIRTEMWNQALPEAALQSASPRPSQSDEL